MSADDAIVARALRDFEWYAENFLKVLDFETNTLVQMRLKPVQRSLARHILGRYFADEPVRVIVLKARREGVSTVTQAIFFWLASLREHQVAVTLSHHDDTTKELHAISERFYQHVPRLLKPQRRRSLRSKEMEFANPTKNESEARSRPGLQSVMRTTTAKNAGAGQGANLVHCSEVGLWDENAIDAERVLNTLLQIVPAKPRTIVVLESTARGVGNQFHARWERAVESQERGVTAGFFPFFIPWFDEPTYREPGDPLGELDAEEQRLRDRYGVDDDQLRWRRSKVRDDMSSLDAFHQEFPATADEAFLSSGRPYFDQESVADHLEWAKRQEVFAVGDLVEVGNQAEFVESRRGFLTVWEPPGPLEDYVIACDSSEGSGDGDPQCAYVYKRSEPKVVAVWHGRVERGELGDHLFLLGKVYNTALIAVEINGGWGFTPIDVLRRRGYTRIYRSPGINKVKRKRDIRYGWDTTATTRPRILDGLNRAIRDGELDCPDPNLFKECLTFVYSDTGKPQAMPGKHDDRVMAASLGLYLWQSEPVRHPEPEFQPERHVLSELTAY